MWMLRTLFNLSCLCCIVQLSGCVVGEVEPRIAPDDTTWIQKGHTTQEQVIARFGQPDLTIRRDDGGQYAEYTITDDLMAQLEPRPEGPFPQTYRPPVQTMPGAEALRERFWVIYDSQGIVQDFGFGRSNEVTHSSP